MNVTRLRLAVLTSLLAHSLAVRPALASDRPVLGWKLVIVDRLVSAGKAKMVFVGKDPLYLTKGVGTDPSDIQAVLDVAYDSASGSFLLPQGLSWRSNEPLLAKYLNRSAPAGGSVKVGLVKTEVGLLKVVAKSLGETPIDISQAPGGAIFVAFTVTNAGMEHRSCAAFTDCTHTVAPSGDYKIACKVGGYDGGCIATTPSCILDRYEDLGATVRDTCTNLEWEKKATPLESGTNPSDPHDVDNQYAWSGRCSVATSKLCQPNLGAETACKAQTPATKWADGCEQCAGGEGTCEMFASVETAITTVWDWVVQLNVATFAGHADWRLATSAGDSTGEAPELESIVDFTQGSCHGASLTLGACIDPVFGPTQAFSRSYWSASSAQFGQAWEIGFGNGYGGGGRQDKWAPGWVRAVRDASP